MRQLGQVAAYVAVIILFLGCTTVGQPTGEQLIACKKDSDCTVVTHLHCCGSTKKAINLKYREVYERTPSIQKTDDPKICAVVGMCRDDSAVTSARCSQSQCQLLWPK